MSIGANNDARPVGRRDPGRAGRGDLPGWRHDLGGDLQVLWFPSFLEAMAFIDRMAQKAKAANHHPDLESHYDRVPVGLQHVERGTR